MPAHILFSWRNFRAASPHFGGATGLTLGLLNDSSPIGICISGRERNGSWRSRLKCFRQNGCHFHCGWARRCMRKARCSRWVHPRNCRGGTGRAARIVVYRTSLATCTRGAMHVRMVSSMRGKRYGARCSLFPSSCQSFIALLLLSVLPSFSSLIGF